MPLLRRILLAVLLGLIFAGIVYFIAPPKSWVEASYFQILIFFIPLLLFMTYFINIFLNYLPRSFSIALGLFLIIVLQAVRQLNYITFGSAVLIAGLLYWFVPKTRFRKKVKNPQIPKLKGIK